MTVTTTAPEWKTIEAAGILFVTPKERALFIKRAPGHDRENDWAFPGGKAEAGEDAWETAIRETREEVGHKVIKKDMRLLTRSIQEQPAYLKPGSETLSGEDVVVSPAPRKVDFTTFIVKVDEEFVPKLSDEHVGYAWAPLDSPPLPMHPGAALSISRLSMNELDVARAMAAGLLTSPQQYANMKLWDMRITGTGYAYRKRRKEHVWREPAEYMTDDFVARCNGMPVIMEHPEKRSTLDSEEFNKRIVGMVFLPYIRPEAQEVWGIVKVYDDAANDMLEKYELSTSPGVILGSEMEQIKLSSGKTILIEDDPSLADHLAICDLGVWDKGSEPLGVRVDSQQDDEWADPENHARLDSIVTKLGDFRIDEACRRLERARRA